MTYPVTVKLYVLCSECKCCLIKNEDSHHCYTCHTEMKLEDICGCGDCVAKAEAWTGDLWLQ